MPQTVDIKQVDKTLVAAFHRAHPPLIWKFDLERNHSFTISLQGEDSDWELGLTAPKGDFYPVARFINQEDAQDAFTHLQKTLMKNTGGIGDASKTAFAWVGLVIIMLVLCGIGVYAPGLMKAGLDAATRHASGTSQTQTGVPLSADDVLSQKK